MSIKRKILLITTIVIIAICYWWAVVYIINNDDTSKQKKTEYQKYEKIQKQEAKRIEDTFIVDVKDPFIVDSEYINNRPKTGDSPYNYFLGKGTYVASSLSEITIKNGTSSDAVVIFQETSSKKIVRNVYIRAGDNYIAKKFPEGIYDMKCCYGVMWNPELDNGIDNPKGGFVSDVSYSATARTSDYFDMRKEKTPNGYSYPTYTVTLHKVLHGNMQTENITKNKFFN